MLKLFRAAYICSRAFSRTRTEAAHLFLGMLFSTVASGQRNVHVTADGNGTFALVPNTPLPTVLRSLGMFALLCVPAALGILVTVSSPANRLPLMLGLVITFLLLIWLIVGLRTMMRRSGGAALDTSGLPRGQYYVLSAVGQLPGSNSGVPADLRSRINALPADVTVVTYAEDEELLARYLRLGFVNDRGLRVYFRV
ncbi:hypothetical protein [Micrococcoides hystricis]|uniref:Uncharacterized protein n=1 Tax=Micrococcoides hystricis TaxID=1572761 RepID=A0ABV6PA58_9MICC